MDGHAGAGRDQLGEASAQQESSPPSILPQPNRIGPNHVFVGPPQCPLGPEGREESHSWTVTPAQTGIGCAEFGSSQFMVGDRLRSATDRHKAVSAGNFGTTYIRKPSFAQALRRY